ILYPAYYSCLQENPDIQKCRELAWYVGIAGNFITGVILLVLSLFGEFIRNKIPGVALLSSLSGVGLIYLALGKFLDIAAVPIVGYLPFAIVITGYFGKVKYGPIPVGIVAMLAGTALGWATSVNTGENVRNAAKLVQWYPPVFPVGNMFQNMAKISPYISTTISTAVSIAVGTIQCVESARRAGDFYPTRESMFADGVGTLISGLFGSIFGMTAYIGHPAYKRMGAKQGYSLVNALIFVPLCFLGLTAPILSVIAVVSINPLIVFVGVIICANTLEITPVRHYPALLIGILPVVAEWGQGTIVSGISSAYQSVANQSFTNEIKAGITGYDYNGLVNFGGGALLQCIFLTVIMMYMIDRKWLSAVLWCVLAAVFAFFGLINSSAVGVLYREKEDTGWKFTTAFGMLAVLFLLFEFLQRKAWMEKPESEPDDLSSPEWTEWKKLQEQQNATVVNNDQHIELKEIMQSNLSSSLVDSSAVKQDDVLHTVF
ncbi:unnamed protein product, partial [Didymodactylos carnosus]